MAFDIKQMDASVVGSTVVLDETELSVQTKDLATVDSETAIDTVLGVKDGEVVQIPISSYAPENLAMSGTGTGVPTNNTFHVWRYGNTVTITVDCCMATSGSTSILTLPAKYRPPMNITSAIPSYTSASVMKYITIYANGGVSIYVNSSTERLLFSMSWAVA